MKTNFASPQHKFADFFDIQPSDRESLSQFRQKVISTLGFYKNHAELKKIESKPITKELKIEEVSYKVFGYDENLIAHKKKQGQKTYIIPLDTEKKAMDLFKNVSEFVKQTLPEKYVDSEGNVWQRL